jgi:rod shape-determining protein MreB
MKFKSVTVIGLDLGAFQTTAVASNGRQTTFRSCVGAASCSRISERDAVVGADWCELQHLVEPFAEGRFRFVNPGCSESELADCRAAARALVRHAVSRVNPQPDGPVYGVVSLPARASEFNRRFMLDAVEGLLDVCLLVSTPIAIAYGLGRLQRTLIINVGAGTVDMAFFNNNLPGDLDQITLPTGLARTDRTFAELVQTRHGIAITQQEARRVREKHGAAQGEIHGVVVGGATGEEADASACLTEACRGLVGSIKSALAELARGVARPDSVILSGGGCRLRELPEVISGLIPGADLILPENIEQCEAAGARQLGEDLPLTSWQQLDHAGHASFETAANPLRRAA